MRIFRESRDQPTYTVGYYRHEVGASAGKCRRQPQGGEICRRHGPVRVLRRHRDVRVDCSEARCLVHFQHWDEGLGAHPQLQCFPIRWLSVHVHPKVVA